MPTLILIAAVAKNRVIGRDNQLIWHLPEDMAHFKNVTQGHTVLMGRKTWESLPPRFRPLPGRRNLVLSRQPGYHADGAEVFAALPQALAACQPDETVFVIGGAEIYRQALPLADTLMLTEIDLAPEGDAYFPEFSAQEWQAVESTGGTSANHTRYAFVTYRHFTQSTK